MIDNIDIAVAKREIEMASILNPGPWVAHSYNVGLAAKYIAEACGMLNPQHGRGSHPPWHSGPAAAGG